ncbi:hypothetical protein [Sphingomonas sanguinis]|uniref:hypothetical protein n=1 Tax=Sphingomonas sanguinis TaxID=33051 RepID=UPI000A675DEE|nr:hypothetical protein [Sphingomonas sanguinis]
MNGSDYILAAILRDIRADDESPFISVRKPGEFRIAFSRAYKQVPSAAYMDEVIEYLIANNVISIISDPFASDYFHWNRSQAHHLFVNLMGDVKGPYSKADKLGKPWMAEVLANIKNSYPDVSYLLKNQVAPASDRVVQFDHNSPEAAEIADKFADVKEYVRGVNLPGVDEQERHRVLSALDVAETLWSTGNLKLLQVKVGVLMAVEDASRLLAETAKQVAVSLLIDAIKAFVKTHFHADLDKL